MQIHASNTLVVYASSVAGQATQKKKCETEIIFGLETSYSKRVKTFPMLTIHSRCVKPGQSRAQVLEQKPQTARNSPIFIQGSGAAFQTLSLYPLSTHARTYAPTHTPTHARLGYSVLSSCSCETVISRWRPCGAAGPVPSDQP